MDFSIYSKRQALIYFSTDLLSSGKRELSKLDSILTFYKAINSSRLSRASLFLFMRRNSFSDLVRLRAYLLLFSPSYVILLSYSIWLAKSIIVPCTCRNPTSTSAEPILKNEAIDWLFRSKFFSDSSGTVVISFSTIFVASSRKFYYFSGEVVNYGIKSISELFYSAGALVILLMCYFYYSLFISIFKSEIYYSAASSLVIKRSLSANSLAIAAWCSS